MATKTAAKKTTKKAEPKEVTHKTIIEGGITQFIEKAGMEGQKARYKAQRAIAYQAFLESVEAQDFEDLVERALENIDELPTGWSITPKTAAKKVVEEVVEDEPETEEDEDLEDEAEAEEVEEADEDNDEEEAPAKKPARRRAAPRRRK